MTQSGEWFVIPSGPQAGWPHMAGWLGTAVGGKRASICPRCGALAMEWGLATERTMEQRHERWHAQTDHRIPPGVMAEIPEPIWLVVMEQWGILR